MFHNCISIVLYKLNTHTCLWPLVHNIYNFEKSSLEHLYTTQGSVAFPISRFGLEGPCPTSVGEEPGLERAGRGTARAYVLNPPTNTSRCLVVGL
jgi:hypothetical protein